MLSSQHMFQYRQKLLDRPPDLGGLLEPLSLLLKRGS
nr:MAG TPA: hypothetical protein [Caudoviricetes sp.]